MFQGPDGILTTLTLGVSRRRLENARLPREQAGPADARLQGLDVREGLDAGGWIVVDQDIVDSEAGAGEEIQVNGAEMYGAIERRFKSRLDARTKAIGADSRRGQSNRDHHQRRPIRSQRQSRFMDDRASNSA